jgi:hypothetical protein
MILFLVNDVEQLANRALESIHALYVCLSAVVGLEYPNAILAWIEEHVPAFTFIFIDIFQEHEFSCQRQGLPLFLVLVFVEMYVFGIDTRNRQLNVLPIPRVFLYDVLYSECHSS